jgi:hypothetical protein
MNLLHTFRSSVVGRQGSVKIFVRPRRSGLHDSVVHSRLSSCRLLADIRWGREE